MNETRDMSQLITGNWKSCASVGCGCLTTVGAGLIAIIIAIMLFGGWMGRAAATPTAVVEPIVLPMATMQPSAPANAAGKAAVAPGANSDYLVAQPVQAMQPYLPYTNDSQTWANSPIAKTGYLAWANLTGQRRTPYVKGQQITVGGNTYTLIAADFDFTLLRDATGNEWACAAIVDETTIGSCQRWERGRW